VGKVQYFGADVAMRVWVDPQKLLGYGLSVADVNAAIAAQVQVAGFRQPARIAEQELSATIAVKGTLSSPEEFGQIVLRPGPMARPCTWPMWRVSKSASSITALPRARTATRSGGRRAAGTWCQCHADRQGGQGELAELSQNFPDDIQYAVPYDTSRFVEVAIGKVIQTLVEAVVLVFLVMWLFLQNLRYTLIPTIVVPVCLAGTLAVMYALGFSVNMMTMFGMVLAIGILVDDAIVVVENVERLMAEEGCRRWPPR
jgi:multidrug efflux pump